jgi:tRNA pseudouridine(55) synthase
MFIQINLFLAVFNLLPIPPFDGSHIVEGCCLRRGTFIRGSVVWLSAGAGSAGVAAAGGAWFRSDRTLRGAAFAWLYGHVMRLAVGSGGSEMVNGWIILDKPLELGSTQAVSAVKRNLRQAGFNMKLKGGIKVGHGGTLDPLASGLLPIALGEATKLTGRMLDASKVYSFTVKFGAETSTLDLEGEVIATSEKIPEAAEVAQVLPLFTGPIEQVPPIYSALKVDGARAYDLARKGVEVELASRKVTIHSLDLVDGGEGSVTLRAHVSKGTYIRSLARDIALALGSRGM